MLWKILQKRSQIMGKLSVAEMFYSLQLEGKTLGIPAVFLRVAGCNLGCPEYPCDSEILWRSGSAHMLEDIVEKFDKLGWLNKLREGAHLVYTGGEPLLNSDKLMILSKLIYSKLNQWVFIEVETNGTIVPSKKFDTFIGQYNVSPKLSNSGEPKEKRYISTALKYFVHNPKAYFKFVVSNYNDIEELFEDFILPFDIYHDRILLMPLGSTHEELKDVSKWLAEVCKEHLFRYSPRMQVHIYDKTVGV